MQSSIDLMGLSVAYDALKMSLGFELFYFEAMVNKYFISIIVSEKRPKAVSFHEPQ